MTRDLRPLFEPRSVAIVGVSADPDKWGHWFARDAAQGAHRRSVMLVGRSGGELFGLPVHRSIAELPEAPELVVLSVPAHALEEAVDDSLAVGAKALVAIAAGFGELGPDGAAREQAIVQRVRAAGAVLVGPNCLGIFDSAAELQLAWNDLPGGPIGFISQSGNIALETGLLLADVCLGYSRLVSVGNQADLGVTELVEALGEHDGTRAIGIYCEDFRDGRAFAGAAAAAGKPIVLLTVGRTAGAVRAARSHTGSLTSDLDVVDAACSAAGIHRVETPLELVVTLRSLLSPHRPRGRRVGIVGDGGGYGAVACDLLGEAGFELPVLSEETQERLRLVLPHTAATANPVDLAGAGEQDQQSFARTTRILLETDEVDAVLFTSYFGGYSTLSDELRSRELAAAAGIAAAVDSTAKPLVVHTMHWDAPPARALLGEDVPVFRHVESAVAALSALARDRGAAGLPLLPPPAEPVAVTDYTAARAALAAAGVPFGRARTVAAPEAAVAAAAELGYPVVLKALGALHKTDGGGVVVGLHDEAALRATLQLVAAASYSVEEAEDTAAGLELLVGARWDVRFGPVVVVGAGGIHAELFDDTAIALAPVDEAGAERLLRSLRCAPLFDGARGAAALDVPAAAAAVAALSRFAAAHAELAELEVNPLLVRREGAVGLDARLVSR
jgi:acyl-CoA synthetase (NDP forming)